MRFATPKRLVVGLRQDQKGARRQLELLCRPGCVLMLRRRFNALEPFKERLLAERTIIHIRLHLTSRPLELFDQFSRKGSRKKDGWREFRAYCLWIVGKSLWGPGPPEGDAGIPPRSARPASASAPNADPFLAVGHQTRYHFHQFSRPFDEVSGDLIEFLWVDDQSFWVLLGDVAGKSWLAHLVAQGLSGQWKSLAALPDMTPGNLMSLLQAQLETCLPDDLFIETVVARFDPTTVTVAPAGMIRVLVRGRDGAPVDLRELEGGLLGVKYDEPQVGHQVSWPFSPGDELAFASDGLYDQRFRLWTLQHAIVSMLASLARSGSLHQDILTVLRYAMDVAPPGDDISVATIRRL